MKTRLITGATRGLGLERTRAALAPGERVVISGRNVDGLDGFLRTDFPRSSSIQYGERVIDDYAETPGMARGGKILAKPSPTRRSGAARTGHRRTG